MIIFISTDTLDWRREPDPFPIAVPGASPRGAVEKAMLASTTSFYSVMLSSFTLLQADRATVADRQYRQSRRHLR